MTFTTQPVEFMGLWAAMMAAMMLPAVTPAVLRLRVSTPAGRHASAAFFVVRYLATWIALGAAAFGALVAMGHLGRTTGWVERGGGGVFIVAGLYPFTKWKRECLRACRRSEHTSVRPASSWLNPLAVGVLDGLNRAGACWALMALLLVVGVMNIPWMAALTLAFVLERHRTLTAPAIRAGLVPRPGTRYRLPSHRPPGKSRIVPPSMLRHRRSSTSRYTPAW